MGITPHLTVFFCKDKEVYFINQINLNLFEQKMI